MGSVFKPFVTRPLPEGAEVVTRAGKPVAVWTDASGKKRQAPATAGEQPRIRVRGGTYTAQFNDAYALQHACHSIPLPCCKFGSGGQQFVRYSLNKGASPLVYPLRQREAFRGMLIFCT